MTHDKRILKADAFKELWDWLDKNYETAQEKGYITAQYAYDKTIRKIHELATPTYKPQESIKNTDGWYSDFTKTPDEYIAHNGCRLAFIEHGIITPLGDIVAFDEEYFKKTVKQWRHMPTIPNME